LRGRFVCNVRVAYCGPVEHGETLIRPLRDVAPALTDTIRLMPVTEVGNINNDPITPTATMTRAVTLREINTDTVEVLLSAVGPAAPFLLEVRHLGGALARPPDIRNAVGHRHGAYNIYMSAYPNPSGLGPAGDAEQQLLDALQPWSDGGPLVNFLGGSYVTEADVRAAYEPEIYRRLTQIKASWDPGNIFRFTHTIPPADYSAKPHPLPSRQPRPSLPRIRGGGDQPGAGLM